MVKLKIENSYLTISLLLVFLSLIVVAIMFSKTDTISQENNVLKEINPCEQYENCLKLSEITGQECEEPLNLNLFSECVSYEKFLGPVPEGYDEDYFRRTGELKKEVKNGVYI